MTKEYGVTHFTELHRILHKYFLIRRCQRQALGFLYFTTLANSRYRALSSAYADGLLVKTAIKTNACHKAGAWFIYFIILVNPCFALYVCFFEANVHSLITPENQMPALRALGFLYFTILANTRYRALSSAYADGLLVKTAIKTNACHKAGAWFIYFIILVNPCFALYVCFFEANVHSLITPENQMPALRALGFL